mmetsp:Transcript_22286/g.61607  ORF Transcript_22286/g.61607 Transcript_22286/m.61607 type:complete len:93 (-) Transcript_22286:300-578(-)
MRHPDFQRSRPARHRDSGRLLPVDCPTPQYTTQSHSDYKAQVHSAREAKAQPAAGHPASVYRATYNIINGGEMRGPRHIFDGFDGRDYRRHR